MTDLEKVRAAIVDEDMGDYEAGATALSVCVCGKKFWEHSSWHKGHLEINSHLPYQRAL